MALAANQWVSLGTRCYLLTMVHVVWKWEHHKSSDLTLVPRNIPVKFPLHQSTDRWVGPKWLEPGTPIWMLWWTWPNLVHQFNSGQKTCGLERPIPGYKNVFFFSIESPLAYISACRIPWRCHFYAILYTHKIAGFDVENIQTIHDSAHEPCGRW